MSFKTLLKCHFYTKSLLILPVSVKLWLLCSGEAIGLLKWKHHLSLLVFFTLPERLLELHFCGLRHRTTLLKCDCVLEGRCIFPHCCIFKYFLSPVEFPKSWNHCSGRASRGHVLIHNFHRWGNRGPARDIANVTQ